MHILHGSQLSVYQYALVTVTVICIGNGKCRTHTIRVSSPSVTREIAMIVTVGPAHDHQYVLVMAARSSLESLQ